MTLLLLEGLPQRGQGLTLKGFDGLRRSSQDGGHFLGGPAFDYPSYENFPLVFSKVGQDASEAFGAEIRYALMVAVAPPEIRRRIGGWRHLMPGSGFPQQLPGQGVQPGQ
jgi:hypothetical protein